MSILKDQEVWFVKCNPTRPNKKFNKANPTWECQIRTSNKEVRKQWEELLLPIKAIMPDEGPAYWRVNLKKKTIKADGENASPVDVVNGAREPIDPDTIGNGSIANIRIFQYEYPKEGGGKGVTAVLMGIQVKKHIVYVPKARDDDFEDTDTETVEPEVEETEGAPEVGAPDVKY